MSNIWIIIIVIIVIAIIYSMRRHSNIKRIFESQALKRNGTIKGRFMNSTLTFSHQDHTVTVSTYPGSKHQSAYTRVVTDVNNPKEHKMKIYGESWASGIGKKLGMQDIQIGTSDFDDRFMIKGNDEYFVVQLLTYNVQDKLLALRKNRPVVSLEHNQFMINVPKVLKAEEEYNLLIDTALLLIDRMKGM